MALITLAAQQSFPAGTRSFEAAVPVGVNGCSIFFSRNSWPAGTTKNILIIRVFWSPDGGLTWKFLVGCTAAGGQPNTGNTACGMRLRDPTNALRRVRVDMENIEPLTTAITVDLV